MCEASACGPLCVSETRQGAKRKKVRLFYSDSIFIPWELLTGFARDKTPEAMLTSGKAVSSPSNNVSKDPFFSSLSLLSAFYGVASSLGSILWPATLEFLSL